jgi:hypothetical protein
VSVADAQDRGDEETALWLHQLYDSVEGGWVTLFSVDRTTGDRFTDWARCDELEHLADIAHERAAVGDVWFGVATRKERLSGNQRGGIKDCDEVPSLWVDIDIAGPNHSASDLPQSKQDAIALLYDFPLRPTVVLFTGGGLQAQWKLTDPLKADEATTLLSRWGATWQQYAVARGWHIDNVFNVDRIMRLPGTWNRKNTPERVSIVAADWTRRYSAEDLDTYTVDPPAPPVGQPATKVPYIGPARPGDAFNASRSGTEVLAAVGFTHARTDQNGDQHWTRPGKTAREGSSATVYAADGHTTIWSDTVVSTWPALQIRRPYDPFGLYAAIVHDGDFTRASDDLERVGYGTKQVNREDDLSLMITHSQEEGATDEGEQAERSLSLLERIKAATYVGEAIKSIPPPRPLIDTWLDLDTIAVLYGPSGAGKSFLALDYALSVATGSWWMRNAVVQGPVVYVAAEGASGIGIRVSAWQRSRNTPLVGEVHWVTIPVNLMQADWTAAFIAFVQEIQPVFVIFDTLARSMVGGDENTAQDTGIVVDNAEKVRRACGACVLIVHHSGKEVERGARGSSALKAAMSTEIEMSSADDIVYVKATKQKDSATGDEMRLALERVEDSCVLTPYRGSDSSRLPPDAVQMLRDLIAISDTDGVSATTWRSSSDVAHRSFWRHLKTLIEVGLCAKHGQRTQARYQPTEQGFSYLEDDLSA